MILLTISFKELAQAQDVSTQLSVVNEVIPLTGTFFSGTEFYTKTYINITSGSALSGGFFQTVFDGAPTSISSSALIDLTYGHSSQSIRAGESEVLLNDEKQRMYKLMAQRLLGSKDGIFSFNNTNHHEVFFYLLRRRIFKDEIKKGNFSLDHQMDATGVGNTLILTDSGAGTTFTVGSAGDEADVLSGSTPVGKIYYNAGIVAIASGAFVPEGGSAAQWSGTFNLDAVAVSGNLDNISTGLRSHINDLSFHNQTNLHSTIYFCRALHSDFNYSTNPSFVDSDGRIVVTSGTDNSTRSYISSIGLYDINDNLLAVAKSSEPVKKSPDAEVTFRVKLSYGWLLPFLMPLTDLWSSVSNLIA